jgi:hypothetical protein
MKKSCPFYDLFVNQKYKGIYGTKVVVLWYPLGTEYYPKMLGKTTQLQGVTRRRTVYNYL